MSKGWRCYLLFKDKKKYFLIQEYKFVSQLNIGTENLDVEDENKLHL